VYRILVVEDEVSLRRIIVRNLAKRGYTVAEADSVASSIEACSAFSIPFDLILLDINLPDQTGWDVLRVLQSERQRTPGGDVSAPKVVVMSAIRPARCRIEEFRPLGVLLKPFPIDALLRLVERVLGSCSPEVEQMGAKEANPDARFRDAFE